MRNDSRLLLAFMLAACSVEPPVDESSLAAKKDRGKGKLGDACGAPSDKECKGDLFCAEDTAGCPGVDGARGLCAQAPDFCILVDDPVCGCDGMTYTNECVAHSHGVAVAYDGPCEGAEEPPPPPPPPPPVTCYSNDACTPDEYCDFDFGCSGSGTCVARPTVCMDVYDPVCGCDNIAYNNACDAAANGQSLKETGFCVLMF